MKLFKLAHQTMNYRAKNRLVVAKILEFAPVTGSLRAGGLFGWNVCTQASYPTGNTKKAKHIYNNEQ